MTQQAPEQQQTGQSQQTGQQQQQQQQTSEYVTSEQLREALANVGRQTRTHTVTPGQPAEDQSKSLLDAINAQPERIVNAIKEAFVPPPNDSKEQQQQTQAKVEAGQSTDSKQETPPPTRQQKFRNWWFGDNS